MSGTPRARTCPVHIQVDGCIPCARPPPEPRLGRGTIASSCPPSATLISMAARARAHDTACGKVGCAVQSRTLTIAPIQQPVRIATAIARILIGRLRCGRHAWNASPHPEVNGDSHPAVDQRLQFGRHRVQVRFRLCARFSAATCARACCSTTPMNSSALSPPRTTASDR